MLDVDRIYNMDCVEGMKLLDDESIDLTVTSPPYDNLRTYNGFSFDFDAIAKELYRVTKDGGVVVWVVGDATINGSETGTSFRQALGFMNVGFRLHDTMIYSKDSVSFPETNRYYQAFEYMFVFSKKSPKSVHLLADKMNKWRGTKMHGTDRQTDGSLTKINTTRKIKDFGIRYNVWTIHGGYGVSTKDSIAFKHPAIFPESLARDHILSWSDDGDLVLDPFMGSGTTAKMAILTRRKYIGFEISSEYCAVAKERIAIIPKDAGIQSKLWG